MRLKSYKSILLTLIPLLFLALSPMKFMVCTEQMQACAGCCPEMSAQNTSPEAQITPFNVCCVTHSTDGFTAITPLQKIEDVFKKKFHSIGSAAPYVNSYALQHLTKSAAVSFYPSGFSPHPPLILVKSSFLI